MRYARRTMVLSSVLVVLPDEVVRRRLVSALERAGYSASGAPTGEAAIDAFVQSPVDVVCIALRLPGRDGATTVESLRWAPGGERAQMVLLGESEDALVLQRETTRLGEVTCLVDDLSDAGVLSVVEGLARRGRPSDSLPPPPMDIDFHDETRRYTLTDSSEGDAVEQHLRTSLSTASELRGSLADVPFATVLAQLFASRATGALALSNARDPRATTTGESPKKVIYFRRGVPRSARSNLVEECLGQILRRQGTIAPHVLNDSLERVQTGQGQQGEVLVSMGVITPNELRDALLHQLETKVLDVFGWSTGTFAFAEIDGPPDVDAGQDPVTLQLSLSELVMRGACEHVPPQDMTEVLASWLDRAIEPVPYRVAPFRRLQLAPECRAFLDQLEELDDGSTLRTLLAEADIPGTALAALVYALVCVGAIAPDRRHPAL
jgi:CheY-like chemotaxis protein